MMEKAGSVLVIGAGIAGMQASLDLADSGFKVYLLDRLPSVGGNMVRLDKTFPTGDCAMCTISPKMVGVGRHPNIEILSYSEVEEVQGGVGDFRVRVRKKARYVDVGKCTGCGLCTENCVLRKKVPDEFNGGLSTRGAAYILFPQAVPLKATIDDRRCLYLTRGKCAQKCVEVCGPKAIDFTQKDEFLDLRVGAILVSTGFELFNPTPLEEYGYGRYPNVLTNLQFERLLSASGPTGGHVQRPSDGEEPKTVAFLQCVGSRDRKNYPYCSQICCMASVKEAVVAKEHDPELKPVIFYMDLRAFGKGFQEYVDRAKKEYGIEFVRGRISEITEDREKNLVLRYEDTEKGRLQERSVEMVVLASALKPSEGCRRLAEILGIETDAFGFFRSLAEDRPFETKVPGIYLNGTCQGPMDIPDSVSQASGAAAKAEALLREARKTEVEIKERPPEREIGEEPRIGVFVCHCGRNIASVVDVAAVAEYARTLPNVVYAQDTLYTCSDDTQAEIKRAIQENDLNRVVVASCTPRTHEPLFRSTCEDTGLNPYLFEMTNIREHCAWVHSQEPEEATEKAKDLVRMAVAKTRLLEPQEKGRVEIDPSGLVLGGGLAGKTAALEVAEQGFQVHLVEREPQLRGPLQGAVQNHPRIQIHLGTTLREIQGFPGNFEVTLEEGETLNVGGVILATGSREWKPEGRCLYGEDPAVMTLQELEEAVEREDFRPGSLVFLQCVGSREEEGERPYCSRTCCIDAVRSARLLKERDPQTQVTILYRDVMTFGMYEEEYRASQEELGVRYLKYSPQDPPQVERVGGKLRVSFREVLLGEALVIEADALVLSTPQVPAEGAEELARVLKIPRSPDGFFMEAHAKLRPLEFTLDGLYLCGNCQGPKEPRHVVAQATGAAARLCSLLSKGVLETEATTSIVDPELCIGCGRCIDVCIFRAIQLVQNEKGEFKSQINPALCKSCGACASVCPNGAISPRQFTRKQILVMIEELLEGSP
jgi:heterodisulfide reductase subunit A